MDEVQRAFYAVLFQRDFHAKTATEFQQWVVHIMRHANGSDFESVRPGGPDGDFKADGRRVSTGTIFQCYAPQGLNITRLNSKIKEDFNGARDRWPGMQTWVLILNTNDGLPPRSLQLLDQLRKNHPGISIEIWTQPELRGLVENLKPAPTARYFRICTNCEWNQLASTRGYYSNSSGARTTRTRARE